MDYSFSYNEDKDYILVEIKGEIEKTGMLRVIEEAAPLIVEHACNKLLGDFRETSLPVNIVDLIEFYKYWMNTLKTNKLSPYQAKRVILLSENQSSLDKFHFFETFSNNRSSRVRLMYDMNEAVLWLTGES